MGDCFSPEIVPHLLSALNDEDDWVKVRALEVLGQHKITEAIPAVMAQLENPNKLVAIRAIECLGAIGGTAAFQALLSISGGEDYELMDAAESAIARIQDEQEGNMNLVRLEKDPAEGRKILQQFLEDDPQSGLVPNALYWIGESYYQEKNYAQAILTFKDVTRRFPKHHKAAASLLKIGMLATRSKKAASSQVASPASLCPPVL